METVVCPKCAAPDVRVWENKRRQLVGKCKSCKKVVSFGRDKDSKEASAEKVGEQKTAAPQKPAAKPAPRTSGAKPKSAAKAKPGRARPSQRPEGNVPAQGGFGSRLSSAFKSFLDL